MPDGRGGIPARRPASGLLAGRLGSRLVLGLALLPARLHLRADLGDLGLVDAAVLVGVDPVEMLRGARGAGRLRFGARDHAVGIGVEMLEHVAVAAVAATMPAPTAMSPMLVWPAHFVARKPRSEEHTSELPSLMRI